MWFPTVMVPDVAAPWGSHSGCATHGERGLFVVRSIMCIEGRVRIEAKPTILLSPLPLLPPSTKQCLLLLGPYHEATRSLMSADHMTTCPLIVCTKKHLRESQWTSSCSNCRSRKECTIKQKQCTCQLGSLEHLNQCMFPSTKSFQESNSTPIGPVGDLKFPQSPNLLRWVEKSNSKLSQPRTLKKCLL